MDPAEWPQVRAILESVLSKPDSERSKYVAAACGDDDRLRREVLSYLSAEKNAGFLDDLPASIPENDEFDAWIGRRLGPWLLERRIGQGGMGRVYEGSRADREYEQRVAIKLVISGLSASAARRFRNERQVLARLEHPHIARLLDGGVTDEGIPYLVMEYIEGEPIDAYCLKRKLGIGDCLALFRTVCSAVEHAHRNLIVHRDLKPGNILVTPQGVSKLLDFGIAKLLNDADDLTRTSERPMTPAYASPEQVRGEVITTATDVYALGVMLYRLLTGCSPYRVPSSDRTELERAILDQEPSPPSAVCNGETRQRLRGDLDAIVLTALRKDPARRYPSVERLSDDVARYMDGQPVSARPDTRTYRTVKFVRRHRAAVTTAICVALALIVAAAVSLEFARQARLERVRAETRFRDLRRLANFFVSDLNDAIRAGPTASRKSVVERGLEYLNRLAADSRGDIEIQRELLAGYRKIGELQGNIYTPNLGDIAGARTSYLRALELAQSIKSYDPDSRRSRLDFALVCQDLSDIAATGGNRQEALDRSQQAIALLDPPAAHDAQDVEAALQAHARIAWLLYRLGEYPRALAHYERYGALARDFYGANPAHVSDRRTLAFAEERTGDTLARMGRFNEGLARLMRALAEYGRLNDESQSNDLLARDVASAHAIIADLLHFANRNAESLAHIRAALKTDERLLNKDPRNSEYRRDFADGLTLLGTLLFNEGQREEAWKIHQQASRMLRETLTGDSGSQYDTELYVSFLVTTPFAELRSPADAVHDSQELVDMSQRRDPRKLDFLARAQDLSGDHAQAVRTENEALALLPSGIHSDLNITFVRNLAAFERHDAMERRRTTIAIPEKTNRAAPGSGAV